MVINDAKSSYGNIEYGVPLFCLIYIYIYIYTYINDIQNAVGPENLRIFADDTALVMSHKFNAAFM